MLMLETLSLLFLPLIGPLSPVGVLTPGAAECFALVERLALRKNGVPDARLFGRQAHAQRELANRPDAVLAVLWGARHRDPEIARDCHAILAGWQAEPLLRFRVRAAAGDFDRFLNALIPADAPEPRSFQAAADMGRGLNGYFLRNGLPTLTISPGTTPFHDFRAYLKYLYANGPPRLFNGGGLNRRGKDEAIRFARCDHADLDLVSRSILLSEGNVSVDHCTGALIISGGDVQVRGFVEGSVIIAAGDVTVERDHAGGFVHAFILAGGKVALKSEAGHITGALFVLPQRLEVARGARFQRPILILEGKPKPAPELFHFSGLKDHGLQGELEQGRVKITAVQNGSPFARAFQKGDVILAERGKAIASVGHFRRLLRHCADGNRLDLQVERAGRTVRLQLTGGRSD